MNRPAVLPCGETVVPSPCREAVVTRRTATPTTTPKGRMEFPSGRLALFLYSGASRWNRDFSPAARLPGNGDASDCEPKAATLPPLEIRGRNQQSRECLLRRRRSARPLLDRGHRLG